jgi:hypothetical protein
VRDVEDHEPVAARRFDDREAVFADGMWGGEWHPELAPRPGDVVIQPHWGQSSPDATSPASPRHAASSPNRGRKRGRSLASPACSRPRRSTCTPLAMSPRLAVTRLLKQPAQTERAQVRQGPDGLGDRLDFRPQLTAVAEEIVVRIDEQQAGTVCGIVSGRQRYSPLGRVLAFRPSSHAGIMGLVPPAGVIKCCESL